MFFLSFDASAGEELASFCFERSANLAEAKSSLSFLLLPNEKVLARNADHCLDVVTTTERMNLLDKFLRKRYKLEKEIDASTNNQQCHLEFKTIKNKKVQTMGASVGNKIFIQGKTEDLQETSMAQLLLGYGKPGVLEVTPKSLEIECRMGATGIYQLTFYYQDTGRGKVVSEVSARKNEVIKIASIINDLDQKNKTLGLPETSVNSTVVKETIDYELQITD